MTLRNYKYRIYPSRKQEQKLLNTFETCREIYNELLELSKRIYKETGKTLYKYDFNNYLKGEYKGQVYSQVIQNISDRIHKAFQNFFRRLKEKKKGKRIKVGFPRFKKFYKSITYPQNNGSFKFKDNKLHVSRIGSIPVKFHRKIKGVIKTLTIKRNPVGQWFAIFSCEVNIPRQEHNHPNTKAGIDVGLEKFAVLSDSTMIENPRFLRKSEKKLRKEQRRLSRKKRRSRNRRKARINVARVHNHILNQRMDFLHKISKSIVSSFSFIAIEKLQVENMIKNHYLAKSIADASWSKFAQILQYKAVSAGAEVVCVNPRGTSQTCSRCGRKVKKSLAVRTHKCPYCGLKIDRDYNSAMEILNRATAGRAGSYACGDLTSTSRLGRGACRVIEVGTIRDESLLEATDAGSHAF